MKRKSKAQKKNLHLMTTVMDRITEDCTVCKQKLKANACFNPFAATFYGAHYGTSEKTVLLNYPHYITPRNHI